ncbi:hypothetical protein K438DRAFT_412908 [Mycena galopus ATCC 62051]|nr:hypothetical protein K438DRAFT_412908 [Mycena galopus ATCC 62051]
MRRRAGVFHEARSTRRTCCWGRSNTVATLKLNRVTRLCRRTWPGRAMYVWRRAQSHDDVDMDIAFSTWCLGRTNFWPFTPPTYDV